VLEFYGNLDRERGDAARAADFYEQARRAYEEVGREVWRSELLEEQAILHLWSGDAHGARLLTERLIEARVVAGDELGTQTATLTHGRVLLVQGEYAAAAADLEPACAYFHAHSLYYYEAEASMALAECKRALGQEVEMFTHLRRALDLAARYDYEYWLQRKLTRWPALFAVAEARELLPPDLREQAAQTSAPAPPEPLA